MEDFEPIEFTAITPGLGLKEPKVLLESSPADLEPPLTIATQPHAGLSKKTSSDHKKRAAPFQSFFCFILDHLFILGFYALLLIIPCVQLKISAYDQWNYFMNDTSVLFIYAMLFLVIEIFYFSFFKRFKIPTLGEYFRKSAIQKGEFDDIEN